VFKQRKHAAALGTVVGLGMKMQPAVPALGGQENAHHGLDGLAGQRTESRQLRRRTGREILVHQMPLRIVGHPPAKLVLREPEKAQGRGIEPYDGSFLVVDRGAVRKQGEPDIVVHRSRGHTTIIKTSWPSSIPFLDPGGSTA